MRSSPRALESVRALEVEVEFPPLYRNQPLFADVDVYLASGASDSWRLRGLRHLAVVGAAPDDILMGDSVLADQAERQPTGGQLSWADAVYVRDDFAAAARESWTASVRDACVATALGLPELVQVALRAAVAAKPPASVEAELERARQVLAGEERGRPDQAITPGYADVTTVERLVFERDEARSEACQLRDELHSLRKLALATRKLRKLRARGRRPVRPQARGPAPARTDRAARASPSALPTTARTTPRRSRW